MPDKRGTIDEYIAKFPDDVQAILEQIRETIRRTLPDAKEKISYGIPAFTLNDKSVVYFSGWKGHVSLHPVPRNEQLKQQLEPYQTGKGTLQFPLDQPIPYEIIAQAAKALATERQAR